jgi:hypothetical protein
LQAPEPFFRAGLQRLEAANGHPNHDIRFSTEVTQASKAKIQQLGLDPTDTTPEELYHVLQRRVAEDDARLSRTLRTRAATHVSAEAEAVSGMIHALQALPDSKRCYALKGGVLKTLIKKQPPKKAMKQLGYRSLPSFLKHESPVSILAAAWLTEGVTWQNRLLDQYKKLQAGDFEDRNIVMLQPESKKWRELADSVVAEKHHNLLSFKELGALVFLPLSPDAPSGSTTVSLSLALHQLNEIRASSTFLKLCQVRSDFGAVVKTVISGEAELNSQLLDKPVAWNLVQRYYARLAHHGDEQVFEPHLQLDDMVWQPVEHTLSAIESSFSFWHNSAHLGILHGDKPVSFNIVDAALNYCNKLPFEQRVVSHFQQSLWHELQLRYLQHDSVEKSVIKQLQPQLAAELAAA